MERWAAPAAVPPAWPDKWRVIGCPLSVVGCVSR